MAIALGVLIFLVLTLTLALAVFYLRYKRLERLLYVDELTGVHTRRALVEILDKAPRRARTEKAIQLVFIDMNGLKTLNAEGGHCAGDQALRELGRRFNAFCAAGEFVARYGGDEFVMLLRTPALDSVNRLERLNDGLEHTLQFTWALAQWDLQLPWMQQINALSKQVLHKKQINHS